MVTLPKVTSVKAALDDHSNTESVSLLIHNVSALYMDSMLSIKQNSVLNFNLKYKEDILHSYVLMN